ncbi:3-ketodihydrosphingosine reductase [Anticarsia gemmatalis]|uniref:3-ketodihydrosphingosine reductase n=1 Tax=Anticarsia gemmatalis TaxID=129554 RepID=UPI003F76A1DE
MFIFIFLLLAVLCGLGLVIHFALDKKVIYKDLKGKHVVITGGSSGIGKAAAVEAARLGAHVTVIGRDVTKLTEAVTAVTAACIDKTSQKIQHAALDVTSDYKVIEECLSSLEKKVGPIFMLVNCAGMCICGQFDKMKVEDIKQMIDLNYFGTAYPTRWVLPGMKERNEGLIVFVSSEAALVGIYGYSAYSAGKWAVRGLAESVNMELVGTGVRLMVAFPPDTDTPGLKNEELTKPEETKLISGTAGLHSADDVGKQMIHDALVGKTYSVYSISGTLLTTLFGGTIENAKQVVLQVVSMGFLRIVMVGILLSFHNIVRDGLKKKNSVKNK